MRVALVGNQNSGKTSLFNLLTGANQKIGNWPGVTIERKTGVIRGTKIEIVDLPGIYSLSPYTSEENISRNFAVHEKPDVIVNIVDATALERSLYLTTQLLELDSPVVIALNMNDLLEKKGIKIDVAKLSEVLGVDIYPISALKKTGVDKLIEGLKKGEFKKEERKIFNDDIEQSIAQISQSLTCDNKRFAAVKILEKDKLFNEYINDATEAERAKIEKIYNADSEQIVADGRYNFIVPVTKATFVKKSKGETVTDKLDKIFLNKWAAIPIFAVIMLGIYVLSVGVVGGATVDIVAGWVESLGEWIGNGLTNAGASEWAVSLVVDGIIAGVGAVLGFVPQLIIMFICLAILETTGYMSRISFFFDRIFKNFGLSGKSLIPFIVGAGCSVPGIMAARTVEDENERKLTVTLTPFIPCSAKLPIISMFVAGFFSAHSGLVTFSLYVFAIVIILLFAFLLKKFYFKSKEDTSFISELPEYKLPSFRYVARDVWDKTFAFIKRAGTIILLCSVIVWFLLSFNWKFEYGIDVNDSMLAGIGNALAWIFYPMLGKWSWGATVSAIQGLVAKEQVVSSMAIIAGFEDSIVETPGFEGMLLGSPMFSFFTPASAYAFMVFNLFSAPCFGAIGAMRRELGSAKGMLKAAAFQTGLAWILACLVFGIGKLIEVIA